jgi:hypothetical protein
MKNLLAPDSRRHRLLVVCVTLLTVVSVAIVVASAEKETLPQQTPPAGKTVEQVQKNIQVLNGLPQAQLIPVMNYMAVSLGVRCNFCHVNKDGVWDYAADTKPEKATAREMIKMVQYINKTNFKGDLEVTCNTCHRGRSHPAANITFPLPEPPAPRAPNANNAEAQPKETPPTADQILDKYTLALGGQAAIDKLQSRVMKGTWVTANGITLGYEIYQSGPDKLYSMLVTPRQGNIERGFDGHVGWEKSARGIRAIEEPELFYLRRYPDLFKDIKLKAQFTRLAFGGKEKLDDKDVYVLRGTTADNKRERLYFDVATGLLLRRNTSIATRIGVIPEQVDFEDYRDVDGIKLPFTIRISTMDSTFSSTRKFSEIKINVPVDQTKFNQPAAPPATKAG